MLARDHGSGRFVRPEQAQRSEDLQSVLDTMQAAQRKRDYEQMVAEVHRREEILRAIEHDPRHKEAGQ